LSSQQVADGVNNWPIDILSVQGLNILLIHDASIDSPQKVYRLAKSATISLFLASTLHYHDRGSVTTPKHR
jgi:hypothetical protein